MTATNRNGAGNRSATGFGAARARNLLVAILVPVALVVMYFAAIGGAQARSGAVPALIVNNDEVATQANPDGTETPVVAGRLLVSWLTDTANVDRFDWRLVSEETAETELAAGNAYVAVTIPEDFSAAIVSLSGGDPESARIDITTDQSHDWLTGEISADLFEGLTAQFGQSVTNMVALGLADGLNESAEGLQDAADGADQLADGIGQLDDGFGEFLTGSEQLAQGTGTAYDGALQFADGAGTLETGAGEYVAGVGTYVEGVNSFATGVSDYTSGVDSYVAGVDTFAGGVQSLADGTSQLADGGTQLNTAAGELGTMSDQLAQYGPEIDQAAEQLEQLLPLLDELAGADPAALTQYCDELAAIDPASAERCRDAVSEIVAAIDTSGFDVSEIRNQLDDAVTQLQQISGASEGLGLLADGITEYTAGVEQLDEGAQQLGYGAGDLIDGGDQLLSAATQIDSGAAQLQLGGEELVAGGDSLTSGVEALTGGATELAEGLGALADGQDQLVEGGDLLGDGIGELADGASTMARGLQDGADQAETAIGDPDSFAEVVAQPVTVSTTTQHDPTFGGVVGSIGLGVGIWLAAMITALRRRIVTADIIDSSASTGAIFLTGFRRLAVPVGVVAVILAVVPHVFLGAPWAGLGSSLLFAMVGAATIAALHLLFAIVWQRRSAAIVSLALLVMQLILVRGLVPLELKSGFVGALSGFTPVSQIAAGLQAALAGGPVGAVVSAIAGLVLFGLLALGIAVVALGRKRRGVGKTLLLQATRRQ